MEISTALQISTALVAVLVAWIGWMQLNTNRQKLRLDLYNRRFDIYIKTLEFYQALSSYDPTKPDEFLQIRQRFGKATRESQFLFDPASGIFQKLDDLHAKSFKVSGFKEIGKTLANTGAHEEFLKLNVTATSTLSQFSKDIVSLEKSFGKYLNFHKASS